jgi:hypothetical protein
MVQLLGIEIDTPVIQTGRALDWLHGAAAEVSSHDPAMAAASNKSHGKFQEAERRNRVFWVQSLATTVT